MSDRCLEIGRRILLGCRDRECHTGHVGRLSMAITEAIRAAGGRHIEAVRVLVELGLAEDTIEADELIREQEG